MKSSSGPALEGRQAGLRGASFHSQSADELIESEFNFQIQNNEEKNELVYYTRNPPPLPASYPPSGDEGLAGYSFHNNTRQNIPIDEP
jgi:hypothetical protein